MCERNGSGVSVDARPVPSRSSVTATFVSLVVRVRLADLPISVARV